MARPHPVLLELAADRTLPRVPADERTGLLASAAEHRMSGLVWSRVARGELSLARTMLHELARQDLRVQGHHLRLQRTLHQVSQQLASDGITVATAKGIAAEARWYDRRGERPCSDVDLVLEPAAVPRIEEIVRLLEPSHFLLDRVGALVSSGVLQSIDLTVDGIEVDLHADILKFEIPTRQTSTIIDRCDVLSDGGPVLALDAETSLVHFLLHLNKDRFALLLAYVDVARILQRTDLDWSFIDRFLAGEGLQVHAYKALDEVVDTLRLPHPRAPKVTGWRATAWEALWPRDRRLQGRLGVASLAHRQFWIPFLARGRVIEAVRWWLRRRLLPPSALVPVYYPGTRGPYLWRLVSGRVRRTKERWRVRRSIAQASEASSTRILPRPEVRVRSGSLSPARGRRAPARGMSRSRDIVFWGGFGGRNIGDEAILKAGVDSLRTALGDTDIAVLTPPEIPTATAMEYREWGLAVIPLRRPLAVLRTLAQRDLIVGGGQLIDDRSLIWPGLSASLLILINRVLGGRPVLFAIGGDPPRRRLVAFLVRYGYGAAVAAICRDRATAEGLLSLGYPSDMLSVSADVAFTLEPKQRKDARATTGLHILVVPGADPKRSPARGDELLRVVRSLLALSEVTITVMTHDRRPAYDLQDLEFLRSQGLPESVAFAVPETLDEALVHYARANIVVSPRMHPLILAAVHGALPVGIPGSSKVADLASRLEIPLVDATELASLSSCWEAILGPGGEALQHRVNGATYALKRAADANARIAARTFRDEGASP